MQEKKCTKCKIIKALNQFSKKSTNIDGLQIICNECLKNLRICRDRTIHGVIKAIYRNQKLHSKNRNHEQPKYSLNEFDKWLKSHNMFTIIYNNWVNSNYNTEFRPFIDRINKDKPYSIDNINLTTFNQRDKSRRDSLKIIRSTNEFNELKRMYRKTIVGLVNNMYQSQRRASKQRGHQMPAYTLSQLKEWVTSRDNFDYIYSKWVSSGYKKDLTPSIDRKDDYKGYSFDNIRLVTWNDNILKSYKDRKDGVNNKISRCVLQYDKKLNFIKEYHSAMQAARENNVDQGAISRVCRGEKLSMYGYVWRYKDNNITH